MAKNKNKTINKERAEEIAQEISGNLLGKPKGLGDDILRYAKQKISNPRMTHMFISNDKISNAFYFKMLAFASIISSAKYGLGIDYSFEDIKEIFEKKEEIEKAMDNFIESAYEKGIGNKKQIEKYKKAKAEAEAKESAQTQETSA